MNILSCLFGRNVSILGQLNKLEVQNKWLSRNQEPEEGKPYFYHSIIHNCVFALAYTQKYRKGITDAVFAGKIAEDENGYVLHGKIKASPALIALACTFLALFFVLALLYIQFPVFGSRKIVCALLGIAGIGSFAGMIWINKFQMERLCHYLSTLVNEVDPVLPPPEHTKNIEMLKTKINVNGEKKQVNRDAISIAKQEQYHPKKPNKEALKIRLDALNHSES